MLHWMYRLSDRLRQRLRAKQWEPHLAFGRTAEDWAHRYLQRQGLTVVARNWRTPNGSGEIDLVAREGHVLAFVEVKARSSEDYGSPGRAIDPLKIELLRRSAACYLAGSSHDPSLIRFDLISVSPGASDPIVYQRDAFR